MQLWQVENFFLHKKVPVVLYRYLFVKKKVFNLSELHFSEVTCYKIPTLVKIWNQFSKYRFSEESQNEKTFSQFLQKVSL